MRLCTSLLSEKFPKINYAFANIMLKPFVVIFLKLSIRAWVFGQSINRWIIDSSVLLRKLQVLLSILPILYLKKTLFVVNI